MFALPRVFESSPCRFALTVCFELLYHSFACCLPPPVSLLVSWSSCVQVSFSLGFYSTTERLVWQVPGGGDPWEVAMVILLYLHFAHIHLLIACIAHYWQLPYIWILLINKLNKEGNWGRTHKYTSNSVGSCPFIDCNWKIDMYARMGTYHFSIDHYHSPTGLNMLLHKCFLFLLVCIGKQLRHLDTNQLLCGVTEQLCCHVIGC